jgi:hypothetical protein
VYIRDVDILTPLNESVIALLIVNKTNELPLLAIRSIRRQSDAKIYVGYLHETDILEIRNIDNIHFIDLMNHLEIRDRDLFVSSQYTEYSSELFFKLVQLKWALFIRVAEVIRSGIIVYSDLDVVWLDDVIDYVKQIFDTDSKISICIQDQTFKSVEKELCMGLFSMRVNEDSVSFLEQMATNHKNSLLLNPRSGDDGVITDYYRSLQDKSSFYLLPQLGFPIGSLANSYFDVGYFSGLRLKNPYIFHANYVVGARRKLILLLAMSNNFGLPVKFLEVKSSVKLELILRKYLLRLIHIIRT